jgi:ABC-type spermidine/putrescine transport system permease subunit II
MECFIDKFLYALLMAVRVGAVIAVIAAAVGVLLGIIWFGVWLEFEKSKRASVIYFATLALISIILGCGLYAYLECR